MKIKRPKGFWNKSAYDLAQTFSAADANSAAGYIRISRNNKIIYLHRWIWEQLIGPICKGHTIDHINGIRTDNRLDNLRVVPKSTNLRNSQKRTDNKSGVAGVSFWSSGNAWRAITHDTITGKQKSITFSTNKYGEKEAFDRACKAREEAMKILINAGTYTVRHGH